MTTDPHEIMRDHAQELFLALEILLAVTKHTEGSAAWHARNIARRTMAKACGARALHDPDPVALAFADALADRFSESALR